MVSPRFDCIVVGAGPAGASAARRLALTGKKVLILERHLLPRRKCCAGGLTPKVGRLLDFDWEEVVEWEVQKACLTYRGMRPHLPRVLPLGLKMVRRDHFDLLLVKKALEAGAELWEGADLLDLTLQGNGVKVRSQAGEARAAVVVGADGALSRVARFSGLRPDRRLGFGLSGELPFPFPPPPAAEGAPDRICPPLPLPRDSVQFDFGAVPRGYCWIFPHGDYLNVGLFTGASRLRGGRSSLDRFLAEKGLRGAGPLRVQGHPIPCFWGQEALHGERVVLCGDAAGLVDPVTGEGIPQAIESGYLAAEAIGRWLDGEGKLADYTRRVQETLGQEMYCASRFARRLFRHPYLSYRLLVTNDRVASLFAQVMRGEVSYQELYRRLKRHPFDEVYSLGRGVVDWLSRWLVQGAG